MNRCRMYALIRTHMDSYLGLYRMSTLRSRNKRVQRALSQQQRRERRYAPLVPPPMTRRMASLAQASLADAWHLHTIRIDSSVMQPVRFKLLHNCIASPPHTHTHTHARARKDSGRPMRNHTAYDVDADYSAIYKATNNEDYSAIFKATNNEIGLF